MTTWHVTDQLAELYAAGAAREPDAWSLEKHVEACGPCAVRVSAAVRAGAAGPVLAGVRAAVLAAVPAPAPTSRPRRIGAAGRLLWAAGPALRGAWAVALVLVAAGAVALAYGAGYAGGRPVLLALAPVLPLAGVAVSYGPYADPMHEITASTPGGGLRLLLTRSVAVLAASLPLLTLAGALLPAYAGVPGAAAWLLPGLTLTLAALALGSYTGCRTATAVIGGGWLLAVLAAPAVQPRAGDGLPLPPARALAEQLTQLLAGATAQGGWAVAALLCAGLLALRRQAYDLPRSS
ncbi:zf-HC2 domain-containing protein [Streptomyces sp. NBC_00370]|uniref:zf-HC2 domain-containing protein n=1 Tax=Streptomyces sp. NBC_00370 TaxID=2975728 RepID=UPI002E2670FA